MDDYFSNTRSNDELTLREAWDNFTKGLISKEQWAETLEGVKRLKQNVPAVAETWARGTIAPIFGGTGDINELGDTTRNKLIDMLPANVGKFAKNLDAAQRLFTPAALTRHLPTTKEVLKSTPRITPEHEGAETMEDVAGFVSPGTLGLSSDILKLGKNLPVGNMITFHGSPNEFERFDPTRVGSGNSTNYGHGIYTAENQNVAKGFTGRTVINEPNVNKFTFNGPDYTIANGQFLKNGTPITQKEYEKAFEGITNLWNTQNKGHIYKVDIPDKHAHKLLDWDKPFSEQTPYVQKIIKEIDPTVTAEETGREIYTALSKPSRYKPNSPMNKFLSENPNLNPQAAASKFLNEKGILGNKYENFQIKQGQGANTHNYVIFDPENLNILERNGLNLTASPHVPGVKKGEELFVHHNLTADKLLEADKLGGMPVPSLAISKTGQPLDKFGDITLIGGKEMATPSAKNPVFRSDAYTKRRPGIDYKMDAKSEKAFDKLFDDVKDAIPDYKGYMFNLKDDMSDMQRSYLLKAKYLNEKGLMPKLSDYPGLEGYKIYGDMNDIIKKNPGDYEDWVHSFREDLPNKGVNVKERIFKGYTYSGNRRYAEANLENMVKEMKGGAGTENWDYGVGNLRAKATPKFRRFEQIREERGRINSELFNKVKDEANKNYSDLTDRLSALGQNYSPTDALHEVAVNKNIDLLDRIYPNITPELKADISVFMNKMQHMPTDYFEIKPQRAVGIGEFKGAIIPKDSSKRVRETLEKHGVKDIHEYTTDEERKSLIDKFGKHMFGVAPVGLGTSEYFERKQK